MMLEDPYEYVVATFQAPPSPDYVPGPEYLPTPQFVSEPVYPEFMPLEDDVLPSEEQLLLAADSPIADSLGYIPEEDDEDPKEDLADYPIDEDDDDDEEDKEDLLRCLGCVGPLASPRCLCNAAISVASQDLWIWHAFFGVVGSNNDINVLYQSTLFNDLKTGRAPEIPSVANGVTYPSRYYLVDGIKPKLAPPVKTIPKPTDDDHKRILYKQKQESTRKDVKRAFGVLKKK
nr:protein ALP1-like isoform X1 [Tanacetum cinerariifolium]